jgi:hypothetical protein
VFPVLQVAELFGAMRDQTKDGNSVAANNGRSLSGGGATLTSLCADISPSSSHFFEVCTLVLLVCVYGFINQFRTTQVTEYGHEIWIMECIKAGSLMTVSRELSRYKLHTSIIDASN